MLKAKEKKERALGVKLFLKAERCSSPKCATVRRPGRPGQHGKARRKTISEYGQQLMEKQKIMFSYGLRESQMRRIFKEALGKKTNVIDAIFGLLERRLDNVVYRLGIAPSRIMARQFVSHGHITVNGKKTTIPSFLVKKGDMISIRASSADLAIFKELQNNLKKYEAPSWLFMDKEKLQGTMKATPVANETMFDINLVVDFYSK